MTYGLLATAFNALVFSSVSNNYTFADRTAPSDGGSLSPLPLIDFDFTASFAKIKSLHGLTEITDRFVVNSCGAKFSPRIPSQTEMI